MWYLEKLDGVSPSLSSLASTCPLPRNETPSSSSDEESSVRHEAPFLRQGRTASTPTLDSFSGVPVSRCAVPLDGYVDVNAPHLSPLVRRFYERQNAQLGEFATIFHDQQYAVRGSDDTDGSDSVISTTLSVSFPRRDGEMGSNRNGCESVANVREVVFEGGEESSVRSHASLPPPFLCCASADRAISWIIRWSVIANIVLLGLKTYAAVITGSLAIIASLVDSVLDILSGILLWLSERLKRKKNSDVYLYPAGKNRIEPLGVIVFACVMGTASISLVQESIQAFIRDDHGEVFRIEGLIVLVFVIIVKGILWYFARVIDKKTQSTIVSAYGDDHRNDTISNAVLSGANAASSVLWWLDPTASLVISLWILYNWTNVCLENIRKLIGETADVSLIQRLTFLAMHFDERIVQVDTVNAYSVGDKFFAEVHIVLPGEMTLYESHDIGEALQNAIERQEFIERAFVHIDFESDHFWSVEHKEP